MCIRDSLYSYCGHPSTIICSTLSITARSTDKSTPNAHYLNHSLSRKYTCVYSTCFSLRTPMVYVLLPEVILKLSSFPNSSIFSSQFLEILQSLLNATACNAAGSKIRNNFQLFLTSYLRCPPYPHRTHIPHTQLYHESTHFSHQKPY